MFTIDKFILYLSLEHLLFEFFIILCMPVHILHINLIE